MLNGTIYTGRDPASLQDQLRVQIEAEASRDVLEWVGRIMLRVQVGARGIGTIF
jgi:hypothetical protein